MRPPLISSIPTIAASTHYFLLSGLANSISRHHMSTATDDSSSCGFLLYRVMNRLTGERGWESGAWRWASGGQLLVSSVSLVEMLTPETLAKHIVGLELGTTSQSFSYVANGQTRCRQKSNSWNIITGLPPQHFLHNPSIGRSPSLSAAYNPVILLHHLLTPSYQRSHSQCHRSRACPSLGLWAEIFTLSHSFGCKREVSHSIQGCTSGEWHVCGRPSSQTTPSPSLSDMPYYSNQ